MKPDDKCDFSKGVIRRDGGRVTHLATEVLGPASEPGAEEPPPPEEPTAEVPQAQGPEQG